MKNNISHQEAFNNLKNLLLEFGANQGDDQFIKNADINALDEYNKIMDRVNAKPKVIDIKETLRPPYYIVETDKGDLELWDIWDELFGKETTKKTALMTAFKYIRRAGFKDKSKAIEDFKKAITCIDEYAKR